MPPRALSPGLLECAHFGVLHAVVGVNACAHDAAVRVDDHSTDAGIGRGQSDTLAREIKRAVQELLVSGMVGHEDQGIHHGDTARKNTSECNDSLQLAWREGVRWIVLLRFFECDRTGFSLRPHSAGHRNERKWILSRIEPVLSGEEACAITTKPGKQPQGLSELREKLACQSLLRASVSPR